MSLSTTNPTSLELDSARPAPTADTFADTSEVSAAKAAQTPTQARTYDVPALAAIAGAVVLFVVLAWPMLAWWYWEYTKPESYYGHALAIPFLVALMVWHRRAELKAAPKKTTWQALFVLVPSLLFFLYARKIEMEAIMSTTFLLGITSAVWFLFGGAVVRVAAFPLAFLWLMAPLPGPVLNDSTLWMQRLSTWTAGKMLFIFHPTQLGNVLQMDNFTLDVDVPCSGFKLLLRLLSFSAAFAYLTDGPMNKRIMLFLISIPLSLFINALRIALIGVCGECLGASAAHTFHDWSGIITTILCMAILFACAKGLGCRTFAGQPIF